MIATPQDKKRSTVKELCLQSSSLNEEELGRLESIMDNFQFISDLLATD